MVRSLTLDQVARIRVDLAQHAVLFDDPQAYVAGVEDALTAVLTLTDDIDLAIPRMTNRG